MTTLPSPAIPSSTSAGDDRIPCGDSSCRTPGCVMPFNSPTIATPLAFTSICRWEGSARAPAEIKGGSDFCLVTDDCLCRACSCCKDTAYACVSTAGTLVRYAYHGRGVNRDALNISAAAVTGAGSGAKESITTTPERSPHAPSLASSAVVAASAVVAVDGAKMTPFMHATKPKNCFRVTSNETSGCANVLTITSVKRCCCCVAG